MVSVLSLFLFLSFLRGWGGSNKKRKRKNANLKFWNFFIDFSAHWQPGQNWNRTFSAAFALISYKEDLGDYELF